MLMTLTRLYAWLSGDKETEDGDITHIKEVERRLHSFAALFHVARECATVEIQASTIRETFRIGLASVDRLHRICETPDNREQLIEM